jgi:hypothetical protein
MDVLELRDEMLSNELKVQAGFGKLGEKGFEGAISTLQMQTYITVSGFRRRRNKKDIEFGWPVALYTLSENLFGGEQVRSAYHLKAEEAKVLIINQILNNFPNTEKVQIEQVIKL